MEIILNSLLFRGIRWSIFSADDNKKIKLILNKYKMNEKTTARHRGAEVNWARGQKRFKRYIVKWASIRIRLKLMIILCKTKIYNHGRTWVSELHWFSYILNVVFQNKYTDIFDINCLSKRSERVTSSSHNQMYELKIVMLISLNYNFRKNFKTILKKVPTVIDLFIICSCRVE